MVSPVRLEKLIIIISTFFGYYHPDTHA